MTQWSRTAVRRPAENQQTTSAKPDPREENSSEAPAVNQQVRSAKLDPVEENSSEVPSSVPAGQGRQA